MTRTTKTIQIQGQPIEKVKAAVTEWARQNHIKTLINNPTYLYGCQGKGILTAPKYYEITLEATPDGVTVKTEGWITYTHQASYITQWLSFQKQNSAQPHKPTAAYQENKACKPSQNYGQSWKHYKKKIRNFDMCCVLLLIGKWKLAI